MGERNPADLEAAEGALGEAILRSLKPKWVDPQKLARRVKGDRWIKELHQKIRAIKARPRPDPREIARLWQAVQVALAAYVKVQFAPEHQRMEVRKVELRIKARIVQIQQQLARERVNVLRSAVGLHHLKKLNPRRNVGGRPTKSRAPWPPPKAIGDSPPPPSA